MSRDVSNDHAPFAEPAGFDHDRPGTGSIPAGGVQLKFRTADKCITITVSEDGHVMVIYDVVNPPSRPKEQ
jgi:hypothetical protein